MIDWIVSNTGTLIVLTILVLIVSAAVFVMVRDKKKGRHLCGGSCKGCSGNCAACSSCHGAANGGDK